ncbi:MAG TPA: hypothetical protein VIL46_14930 [Gemmataceae bacterium]
MKQLLWAASVAFLISVCGAGCSGNEKAEIPATTQPVPKQGPAALPGDQKAGTFQTGKKK